MPIVTAVPCFEGYSFRAIDPALAASIRQIGRELDSRAPQVTGLLLRLECFLQLSGKRLRSEELGSEACTKKLERFVAALYSSEFQGGGQPWALLCNFREIFVRLLGGRAKFPQFPCTRNQASWPPGLKERVDQFSFDNADPAVVEFWKGWVATNIDGRRIYLKLWPVWEKYGRQMALELHDAVKDWFGSRRYQGIPCFNEFIEFLCAREVPLDTQDPVAVGKFFREFFEAYCRSKHGAGLELSTLTANWLILSAVLRGHLLSRYWAAPIPALPTPSRGPVEGLKTHLHRRSDGIEVRHALMTPVPIQITDCEAKELLFHSIRNEVEIVLRWARAEIAAARLRLDSRERLSALGVVNRVGRIGTNTGIRARLSRDCPEYLAHAAATFEQFGFAYLDEQIPRAIFPLPLEQTTWELGLPTPELLLAHAALLVGIHPSITTSFLENLALFDKDGQQIGLIKTDAGWYLVGNKRRKGSASGQQKILLTTETLEAVRELIRLTQPVREYMKAKNDERWRRLFLCTRSLGHRPNSWDGAHVASHYAEWIGQRLHELTGLATEQALDLANRFSLKRLRSSAGVLVYIETGSVAAMSKALGHSRYIPKLLDHYLPGPIQEFFVERWVRLFQMGILCEALKESSYLQELFDSMDELDTFLENHAIRSIPQHLCDPDNATEAKSTGERRIIFGISVPILSVLRSLQYAVENASTAPCGRAVRWALISERLFNHLETQTDQPEFRLMAAEANGLADAATMEAVIHG